MCLVVGRPLLTAKSWFVAGLDPVPKHLVSVVKYHVTGIILLPLHLILRGLRG